MLQLFESWSRNELETCHRLGSLLTGVEREPTPWWIGQAPFLSIRKEKAADPHGQST